MVSSEDNTPTGLVVRHKLSLRQKLAAMEHRTSIGMSLLFAAVLLGGTVLLGTTAGAVFCLVMLVGFFVLEFWLPHLAAEKRAKLIAMQLKMANGQTHDLIADTQRLIQGYLAIKEFATAEHFSAVLLKQSSLPAEQRDSKLNELMASSDCWLNIGKVRPFHGFDARGILTLTNRNLSFESLSLSFSVDLADMQVETAHHEWWQRHIGDVTYLVVKFADSGQERVMYLSPSESASEWCELIKSSKHKRGITRVIETMRAQIADVETNTGQTKV